MAITDRESADLRSLVVPMSEATSRLADDGALAERLVTAVHAGDSATVSRVLADAGVRGVTHRSEPQRGIPGKTVTREVLDYSPNERWHIEIHIEISK